MLSISTQQDAQAAYINQQALDSGHGSKVKGSAYAYGGRTYDTSVEDFKGLFQSTKDSVAWGNIISGGDISDATLQILLGQRSDSAYQPQAGDLIIYRKQTSPGPHNHVGIVYASDSTLVYSIEGNAGDAVSKVTNFLNSISILGYCKNGSGTTGEVPTSWPNPTVVEVKTR